MSVPPTIGVLDGLGVPVDGHLRLMALLAIIALCAAYALLLWAIRSTRRTLRTIDPGGRASVDIEIVVDADAGQRESGTARLRSIR